MGDAPIVVLTGCTRGLGRALAGYFVGCGATVAGCGRSAGAIEQMMAEFGSAHDFSALDVRDDAEVAAWAKRIIQRFGAPNLLLNNAAVIARNAPLWEVPKREVASVLEVNIAGTVNTLRHFVPAMIQHSRLKMRWQGAIVNFSSGWGRSTSPDVGIYCASKWAIEGLTQSLAQDLAGTGLRAYALNPGIIDTEMLRECFGEESASYPGPDVWVKLAGPYLMRLWEGTLGDNECSVTVPEIPLD